VHQENIVPNKETKKVKNKSKEKRGACILTNENVKHFN
jgi:hypothetical protein